MMTKQRTQTRTAATTVKTNTLTAQEEKVVRMRHGLAAPGDLVLEQVGQDHPETAAQLADMERRALSAAAPRSNATKRRIVSALRQKNR